MKKLTLAIAAAALLAANAYAQTSGPGQDQAATAKPATAAEKAAAKGARKEAGKEAVKTTTTADAEPSSLGAAKSASQAERSAAASKRKAAGAKATKQPKDMSGPNS